MKKDNTFQLENKLKAYSAIAMGVLGVGSLNAQIVYHTLKPYRFLTVPTTASGLDSLSLDIDGNGVMDFEIQLRSYATAASYSSWAKINSLGDTVINKVMQTLGPYTFQGYAIPLALNAPITPGDPNFQAHAQQAILASLYGTTNYGTCDNGGDAIVGIRFASGTNTLYGWIRMSGVAATGQSVTLKDWAYQSTTNTAIIAGQIESYIKDLTPDNIKIAVYNGQLYVNLNADIEGRICVMNVMGLEVLSTQIDNLHTVLDVTNLAKGPYIVSIKTKNNVYSRKVSIN